MPLGTKLVGVNEHLIAIFGDPTDASGLGSVLTFADARSLAGKYGPTFQSVGLLLNPAGTYDLRRAAVGTTGVPTANIEGTKPTYSVGIIGFTPAATATDFWALVGHASKVVRLLMLRISGIATSASTVEVQLIKRSTDNTGGTSSSPAIAPHDSNDSAASAVVRQYSVNPTALGTSVGVVRASKLNLGAAGAAGEILWDFTTRNSKGVVLRGAAQILALNWNGAAVPAGTSLAVDAEFSEEPL